MPAFICSACGTQYPSSDAPPAQCPVCEEERQYIPPEGQSWTTLERLRISHHNGFRQYEPGLIGIGTQRKFAIGQRAMLLCTAEGNILWDCISLIDDATITLINGLGGRHRDLASPLLHDAGRLEPCVRGCLRLSPCPRRQVGEAAGSLHQVLAGREIRTAQRCHADTWRRTLPRWINAALGSGSRGQRRRVLGRHRDGEPGPEIILVHAQHSEPYPPLREGGSCRRGGADAPPFRSSLQPPFR